MESSVNRPARWGLLLVNLGTPDLPRTAEVRRYLAEFLHDPRVIDIAAPARWALVNLAILPFRPRKSAEAYQTIWTERGSPLLFHGLDLVEKLRARVSTNVHVELAMRYQNPSIESALERFRSAGIDDIVALPLFPQYSSAAFGSVVEKVYRVATKLWVVPNLRFIGAFYDHPAFIEAFAAVGRPALDDLQPDRILFSYHGVPERHVIKSEEHPGTHCLRSESCCDQIVAANRHCYRAQCYATTRALADTLGLESTQYEVAFQSRLGRDPWIRPYTDERIVAMAQEGIRRLAVFCPAFVADCLETLEEIGMRAQEDFRAHGGEELRLVPSLNSSDRWVEAVVRIVMDNVPTGWIE
jgi:ferrochelatase